MAKVSPKQTRPDSEKSSEKGTVENIINQRITRRQALGKGAAVAIGAAVVVVGAAGYVAYVSRSGQSVSTTQSTQPAASGSVSVWTPESRNEDVTARNWLIQAFQQANPNLTINLTVNDWTIYEQKVQAAVQAKTVPDILYTYMPDNYTYFDQGIVGDMSSMITDIGLSDYPQALTKWFHESSGAYTTVPWFGYPHVLWYRKDVLQQNGIQPPTTMDEYLAACKALTDASKGFYGTESFYLPNSNYEEFTNIFSSFGSSWFGPDGKTVTINSPETVQALEFMAERDKYAVPGGFTRGDETAKAQFASGSSAFIMASTSTLNAIVINSPDLLKKVSSVAVPMGPKSFGPYLGFSGFAISANSANKNAAAKFIEFMFKPENMAQVMAREVLGFIPAQLSVQKSSVYLNDPHTSPYVDILKAGQAGFNAGGSSPGAAYGPTSNARFVTGNNLYQDMLTDVVLNGMSAQDAVTKAESKIKQLMQSG